MTLEEFMNRFTASYDNMVANNLENCGWGCIINQDLFNEILSEKIVGTWMAQGKLSNIEVSKYENDTDITVSFVFRNVGKI